MKKCIFLCFSGLDSTIIESQVILHAQFCSKIGCDTEVWFFPSRKLIYDKSKKKLESFSRHGVKLRLFKGYRYVNPFSILLNAFYFLYLIAKEEIKVDFVHGRTEYAAVVALLVKPFFKYKVISDIRGDSIQERVFLAKDWHFVRRLLLPFELLYLAFQKLICKIFSDKFIFVSKKLRTVFIGDSKHEKTYVLPCLVDEKLFFFNKQLREKARHDLGINTSDIVFIYSGSVSKWQCVDKVVTLIEDALNKNTTMKVIILTPQPDVFFEKISRNLHCRIISKLVKIGEVNYYLNASDFAIFIRNNHALNAVASPVKFAEYCMSGLSIIMTDAVEQSSLIGQLLTNKVDYDNLNNLSLSFSNSVDRSKVADKAKSLLTRTAYINRLIDLYEL